MTGVTPTSTAHIQLTAVTFRRLRATQYSRTERCASTTNRKIPGGIALSAAHSSAEKRDAFGQRALASISRQHTPIVLGVCSEATSQERA